MAWHIDGRREPTTLAAGVFVAHVDGVICGVGSGPMRGKVGGFDAGGGSKKRGGQIDAGVGVVSS